MALGLLVLGLALSTPELIRGTRAPWAPACFGVVAFWMLYGLAIGSTPPFDQPRLWFRFLESEGRLLAPIAALVVTSGLPSRQAVDAVLRRVSIALSVVMLFGLALFNAGVPIVGNRTFTGFTSGHHVPGFLCSVTALVLLFRPDYIKSRTARLATIALLLLGVLQSGSRASVMGLAFVGLYVLLREQDPRRVLKYFAVVVVCVLAALAISERTRNTVTGVASVEFVRNAVNAFEEGDPTLSRQLARNREEVNAIKRFGLFGRTVDQFQESPLIGVGPFRFNDQDLQKTGVVGLVSVAIGGERVHNEFTAHNMYLQLAAEVGLIGLTLYLATWVRIAWFTRGRSSSIDADESMATLSRATLVFSLGVGFTSSALLGAGLGLVAAIVIAGGATHARTTLA